MSGKILHRTNRTNQIHGGAGSYVVAAPPSVFRAGPAVRRAGLGLLTQDFILGYFRFLPTGGMTAAPTAAPESSPANHCRLRRVEIKPLTQCPERHVNPVDLGGVLEIRQAVYFLPCGADPPRQ